MNHVSPKLSTVVDKASAADLQSRLQGTVITADDPLYDQARRAWNLMVDQRPALIVAVENVSDVAEAVHFARSAGLGIAIQAAGHGNVRPADDCLLILTSRMNGVRVDIDSQTAWIEAGAKWGQVLEKAQAVGLAPLLGSSPDVGAIGYTLGGGFGWLGRKFGLAADSVRAFELVTADGQIRRVSSIENSDLFWGQRGGGGNFGVVTGMEVQLYPVTTVYGGNLFYPADQAGVVYRRYRDWIASAPDELTSSIVIMNFPPIPDIPEPLRGQTFVIIRGCYCGSIEEGEALVQGWREWQAPLIDNFKAMPFSQVATISNDPVDPMPGLSTGAWLRELSDEAIDILIRYGASVDGSSPITVTEIRHAGGAVTKADARASAYGNREATLLLQLIGLTPSPEAHGYLKEYTEQFKRELAPHLTGGVYMNFLEGEESRVRARDGITPASYAQLISLKAKYDPDNRFSYGFQIPPAAGPGA
jgi:hypothetical protein